MTDYTKPEAGLSQSAASLQAQADQAARIAAQLASQNWLGLLAFIGEANWHSLVLMTGGDHLLPAGAEPPVAERMGSFGRVLRSTVDVDGEPVARRFADLEEDEKQDVADGKAVPGYG